MNLLKAIPDFDCKKRLPGNGCKLPILPGHYGGTPGGTDAIVIKLPKDLKIPEIVKLLLKGTIDIHLSIADKSKSEIVCTKTEVQLDF